MDVGLDEEVEGLLPPGVNLSLEFGEAVLGAAVEGGEEVDKYMKGKLIQM